MKNEPTADLVNNETLKTIFERRAVRKYLPAMIDDDLLEKVLDAGRMAPSAMNEQPWKFYIATHQDTIAKFSKAIAALIPGIMLKAAVRHPLKTFKTFLHMPTGTLGSTSGDLVFHGAPVVIFITSSKDNEWAGLDIGMCAQNMMLAARSLGLDSCPVGLGRYMDQTPVYHELEVPAGEAVQLAIILGYGAEEPTTKPRAKHTAIFIDRMECC